MLGVWINSPPTPDAPAAPTAGPHGRTGGRIRAFAPPHFRPGHVSSRPRTSARAGDPEDWPPGLSWPEPPTPLSSLPGSRASSLPGPAWTRAERGSASTEPETLAAAGLAALTEFAF